MSDEHSIYGYKLSFKLASQLPLFRSVGDMKWNFRCPICNDSAKNPTKARGNVYQKDGELKVKCFNCNYSSSFSYFLYKVDPQLWKEYRFQNYRNTDDVKIDSIKTQIQKPQQKQQVIDLSKCVSIESLPYGHIARNYVIERKISHDFYNKLFYIDEFNQWIHTHICPSLFKNSLNREPRLVIPFYNENNECFALAGRSFRKYAEPKYLSINPFELPMIYGKERWNLNKQTYVCEGMIDSLFIPNCLASNGIGLSKIDIPDTTYIFDNQPRNKEVVKIIESVVNKGHKIFIFPDYIKEKDINDMIVNGYSQQYILDMIDNHIVSGLKAKLMFQIGKR